MHNSKLKSQKSKPLKSKSLTRNHKRL